MRGLSFLPYTIICFLMTMQRYGGPKKIEIGVRLNNQR